MTPANAEKFLRLLGSTKFNRSTMPWFTGQCPVAKWRHQSGRDNDPSFGILTGKYRARAHCFSCGLSGSLESVIGEIKLQSGVQTGLPIREIYEIIDAENETLGFDLSEVADEKRADELIPFPDTFWSSFSGIPVGRKAHQYLSERGVSDAEISEYDIRWDGLKSRVCFPVRGFDKLLYGVRGRSVDPHEKAVRYWSYPLAGLTNPQVWYGEEWVNVDEPILVTESVFGLVAARRFYKNTIAPLSASITPAQMARMGKAFCFVHLFDGDKAGKKASGKLSRAVVAGGHRAAHTILELPEGHDPDSLYCKVGPWALAEIISKVLPIRP